MSDNLINPIYYVSPISQGVYNWLDESEVIEEKRSIELANRTDELIMDLKTDIGLLVVADDKYTNIFMSADIETMIHDVIVEVVINVINHDFYPDELLTYAYYALTERFEKEIKNMEDEENVKGN